MDGGEHQGHCTAHQAGVVAEGRLWRAGRVCLGVLSLVAAMLAGELGLGIGGAIDIDKGLENKREKGGNATKHTGIETSKRPKLVGIQHQGAPRRPRKQRGALGGGEPRAGLPALADQRGCQAASWLPSLLRLQLSSPPGRYWLQAST